MTARSGSATFRRNPVVHAIAIAVAGAAAHAPSLGGGFVFDDHSLVEHSAALRGPLSAIWLGTATKDYWPLTYSALWVQWRLFGESPFGFHLVNLALHLATALLLWRALRALAVPGAWIAGLIFAVHPVTVDSAGWISEQKNTLSATLFLVAVLAWTRHARDGGSRSLAASAGAFAAALLAKTSVVMGPFVLLAIRLRVAGRRRPARGDLLAVAPFFGLSLAAGVATLWFQHHHAMAGAAESTRGAVERIGGAAWALLAYLQTALAPIGLGIVYPAWPVGPGSAAFFVPLAAVVAGGAVVWRYRDAWARPVAPALGYHALMLLPVLGFVEIAYFALGPIANHLQYVALFGPVALAGYGLGKLPPRAGAAAAGALAALLAAASFQRSGAYQSDVALWREAVRAKPSSDVARLQLASVLASERRDAEAIREYRAAEEVTRDPERRLLARAYGALYAGEHGEAAAAARALAGSGDTDRRRDAALVLAATGDRAGAIAILEELVRRVPASSDYAYWLGAMLSQSGRVGEASEVLRAWCTARPGNPKMEQAYAFTLIRLGNVDEAYRRAAVTAGVAPGHPEAAATFERWAAQWRLVR